VDSKTTVEEVKQKIIKFQTDRGWDPDARSLAISIALEASELLEHFQWKESTGVEKTLKTDIEKRENLEKEVADVVFYLCEFCNRVGIDISSAVEKTIIKNNEKYPIEGIKKGGDDFYFSQKKKYRAGRK
jgi:dCTP diphosphatase